MSSIICARITPKPSTASSTKKVKSVSQSPTKIPTPGALDTGVMKTARFAEAVNGRAAMQGVLWGSLDWMMSGENIIQQLEDPMYAAAATGVVTTLAAASLITAKDFGNEEFWNFTPEAELKNGRLAMLGFTTLLGLSAM
jgi:hypothetical protein